MSKEYITKYRIVNNPSYNDFNDELPYTIVSVDYDPKTDLIRQKGFNGWSKIGDKLYDTRQECEKHFVFEINYELDNNVADLEAKLAESEDCNNMLNKCLTEKDIEIETQKEENAELQKQLEEKEKEIRQLDNEKGMLLNNSMKLLKEKDDKLKSQLAEIVEKIKKQIFNHFNVKNMEEYDSLSLIDSLFTADAVIDMLNTILKEYQK